MKVVIISCFASKNNYDRGNFMYNYFKERNYDCHVIYSEFNHGKKRYIKIEDERWIPIKTLKYSRNISIKRIISHISFSLKCKKIIKKIKPDIVYMAIPPNSVSKYVFNEIKKIKGKSIIDIVDLWPESLPLPEKISKGLCSILRYWKNIRNYKVTKADALVFECNLYKKTLQNDNIINQNSHIIHLCKSGDMNINKQYMACIDDYLNICYLGYINSLIDIELIVRLLSDLSKRRKVKFHIIGTGEKKYYFISELEKNNIKFKDYGAIYNELEKSKILSYCDFAINLYKENTKIGLTYKSIDYFASGVPIINSVKCDTWDLVDEREVGINYKEEYYKEIIDKLSNIKKEEISKLKKNAFELYMSNFEQTVIEAKMDIVMKSII